MLYLLKFFLGYELTPSAEKGHYSSLKIDIQG